MEQAEEKLKVLLEKAKSSKVDLSELNAIKKQGQYFQLNIKYEIVLIGVAFLYICGKYGYLFESTKCSLLMPKELQKVFRYPANCNFCRNVNGAKILSNIEPDDFEQNFAYNGNVVIVTDAMINWTAPEVFDFWYFKNLYEKEDPRKKTLSCQFFPYKTKFLNLFETFKMDVDRILYKDGTEPWYFGWSNCNEHIAELLRKHYDRPYFLPKSSELNAIDWVFMGGKGLGAHMHLDDVNLPSWQAQLKGTKQWFLAPPPECIFECNSFSVLVNPGDMIVLDTNRWYHKTNVVSKEISITIGAEYD